MSKRDGLKTKYTVTRLDNKPIRNGCIVLEWDDPIARVAIKAFAEECREKGYYALADDIDRKLITEYGMP